ncbi:ribonuclease HIII [Siminovitchia sp. FSL H7-0308]|uniref:Ribonuclease HIII n=1 Tax=Siminovitchia thermophila TaxID=1245522 RepID=A0ABS2R6K8_9BACI|nr:ribonuclease HIII [Siminovitchia thermophila]MBM7714759.1 ribonuclease HIII [Siminovitchia thermophila]ONK24474.1 ribonuclease HIII [Bacillus sp. VT-16-64]
MANIVIQAKRAEIDKMKEYYRPFLKDTSPPGSVFSAKKGGCTITAYRSGKVMFQGVGREGEAGKWANLHDLPTATKPRKASGTPLPENITNLSVIGSDEVGKGDYFGPLAVVAAYVKKEHIPLLKELGVKDSKHLSDKQITDIAKDLLTFIPYSSLKLNNKKYNEAQASGMTQGKMTAILHNRALLHVLEKIAPEKPEAILVDQFAEAQIYFRHLKGQETILKENVYFSTKAESIHLAVAAASILARYSFLQAMEQLSKKAGFSLPKGAGSIVDVAAARLIRNKGLGALSEFAKVHFANTEKAKKIAGIS